MKEQTTSSRKQHFDLLRIIACFSVVMLHSSAQYWYGLEVTDHRWLVANSYDAVFRFGVPVFVMISGALFLGREKIDTKKLYKHNILRILILYVVWSVLYGLFHCRAVPMGELTAGTVFREILSNSYHLWFLPMIAGLYMLVPILHIWIKNATKKDIEYLLLIFFVLQILLTTMKALVTWPILDYVGGMVKLELICGYSGYFVLGYYLDQYEIERDKRKVLYIAGVISVIANIVLGNWLSLRSNTPKADIYDSFGLFTCLVVMALFVACRSISMKESDKVCKMLKFVADATLGIYLLHIGVMDFLNGYGVNSMMVHPLIGIPLLAAASFLICLIIAKVLQKIPAVGRYIC